MDLLLTGASGLIGQSLVRQLLLQHRVACVVRSSAKEERLSSSTLIEQDLISDLDYTVLPDNIDAVIHLAQSRRFREFPGAMEDIFSINTYATVRLAEYARKRGAKCFIFASTGGIYVPSFGKIKEDDPVYPSNFYFGSKYAAELLLSAFTPFFRVVILRFFFVYGTRQRNMLIPNLLGKILKAVPISIEGNPGLHINPIHVEDAVKIFSPILENSCEGIFNVAGDEVLSITDLVNLMAEVSGKAANILYTDTKYTGDLVADNNKMKRVLGVEPQISLRQGISEMCNFSFS